MLAGASALQRNRAGDHLGAQALGGGQLLGPGRVEQIGHVEVAVADMADDEIGQAGGLDLGDGGVDVLGQPRDRHAGVGRHRAAAGAHLQARQIGVVARGPQPGAGLGRGGPLEGLAAMVSRHRLHHGRLLGHAGLAAVELHQQHRRFLQAEPVVRVDGPDRVRIQQLAARDRHADLDDLHRRAHRRIDAREEAHRGRHRLGQRVHLQGQLGDDAQRALAAHQQPRQVVAGAALLGPRTGAHHLARRIDEAQPEHVLAHRAVAHRIRAAGARGGHAAERRIGTGVDREEQALVLQRLVELLAGHARLHGHGEVIGVDAQHLGHARHIQADATAHGQQVPFQRRARAKRDDRHAVPGAQRDDLRHLALALREHDGLRRRHIEDGFIAAMLFAHRRRGRAARTEPGAQGGQQVRRQRRRDRGGVGGRVHRHVS
mmetsp:Transcript_6667/g.27788  ORF Transcript_6667/g.27788 Transcript_6667/m.27788 type:complete len:431 (+) Transcript_6667:1468-2760(+)